MGFKDAFKPNIIKADEKIVNEKINLTGQIARSCLNLPQFKAYKDKYIKAESKVIGTMLLLTASYMKGELTLETYGTKVLVYMTRLGELKRLIGTVTTDAKKGKVDE